MRRRTVLATGTAAGLGFIAGCLGGDDEDGGDSNGDSDATPTPEPPDEPDAGELSYSVATSKDEIDWGDEYSVTVTAQAGEDPPETMTAILYQTEDESMWSGSFRATEMWWRLDAGDSQTETFEIEPPAAGELTFGLMDVMEEDVIDEWDLMVNPPVQSFGESLSYYDGLDVTLEVELPEWLEFELKWSYDPVESGMYSVRPREGQWVKVSVTAENTNTNEEVSLPDDEDFNGLAGSSQLYHFVGRELVGEDTDYEVDNPEDEWDPSSGEDRPYLEVEYDDYTQEGYWDPPREIISGALEEGWLLFVADADVTVEDIEIRLNRNDLRATWE